MSAGVDAFTLHLASLSGRAVALVPPAGGIEGALAGMALHQLCASHGLSCLAPGEGDGTEPTLFGSAAAAERVGAGQAVFVPGSVASFGDLEIAARFAASLFFDDAAALRRAELTGLDPARLHLCHDLAIHLDLGVMPPRAGEGTLVLNGRPCAIGDQVTLRWDGRDGRWASSERCRDAVASLSRVIAPYARVRTESVAIAILACKLGKSAVVEGTPGADAADAFARTVAPSFPDAAFEGDLGPVQDGFAEEAGPDGVVAALKVAFARQRDAAAEARREAERAAQAREQAELRALAVQDEADARAVAAVRRAERALDARIAEVRSVAEATHAADLQRVKDVAAAEQRLAAERGAAADEARRAAETTAGVLRRGLEGRLAAIERARREASDRDAASSARLAQVDRDAAELRDAVQLRDRQTLALQSALDESEERRRIAEARTDQVRRLLEARSAALDEATGEASAARRALQGVLSSTSWRASGPLRRIARALRRAPAEARRG